MTTVVPSPFQASPSPKLPEETEDTILRSLVTEAFDHPSRAKEIVYVFIETMKGLIDTCSKTQDIQLAKRLAVASDCLTTLREAFAAGSQDQNKLIAKHEREIESISQAAIECITGISKEKRTPTHSIEKPDEAPHKEHSLESLVGTALHKGDDDALLSYIVQGAPLKLLPKGDAERLAEQAAASFNDAALATLIRGGCQIFNPEGQSPLLLSAVSNNLMESANALINRHANLHTVDAQGNTALHRAFFLGNPEMTVLLTKHIDPQSMNTFGQTPLMALLNVQPQNLDYIQLPETHVPHFLEAVLKRPPEGLPAGTASREMLLKISGGKAPNFPADMVEMAFLANDPNVYNALFYEIDTETFLSACSHLEERYPRDSIARFMATPFDINDDHYRLGGQSVPLHPLGAKNPPLGTFLTLFDKLNFYKPDAPHYVDAIAWLGERSTTKEVLPRDTAIKCIREALKEGLDKIIKRVRYAGVPSFEPEKWFARIELYLKNVIISLQEKNNPATTLSSLKELRKGFQHCATALTTSALTLYEQLCFNIDTSDPRRTFLRPLANFRRQCFDDAVNAILDAEIHHGHRALVVLGPELGLPGHEEAAMYQDPSRRVDCKPYELKFDFTKRYTPQSIVDWLLQALKANIDNIRDSYIDLHKRFMNPNWNKERYSPMYEGLANLEKEGDTEKRQAAIDEFLAKSDIVKASKNQPSRKAIEEDQFQDYLEHFVFDEKGLFRPQAAVYILARMGVIRSRLR